MYFNKYYAIICNTLVNFGCNKYSSVFPLKGKKEVFGRLKIVSYPANLSHNIARRRITY